MGVTYKLQGQVFEWDAAKAASNLRKHNISFEQACEVFFDPFVRLVDAGDSGEVREAAIGLTEDWSMLFVVDVSVARTPFVLFGPPGHASERKDYEVSEDISIASGR